MDNGQLVVCGQPDVKLDAGEAVLPRLLEGEQGILGLEAAAMANNCRSSVLIMHH